jgi:hypothetical protein
MGTLVRFRDKQAFYVRCLTTLSRVEIVWRRRWVCEWVWGVGGIIMTGKTEALGVKAAPVTLFPHWLIWSWSRISAVRGRWQTAWAMAGPGSILRWFFVVSLRLFNNAVPPHTVSSKWKDRLYRRRSQDFEFVVLIYVPDFYLGRVKGTTQDSSQGVPYSVRNLKWMPAFWTHYLQHYQYTIVVFFRSCSSWMLGKSEDSDLLTVLFDCCAFSLWSRFYVASFQPNTGTSVCLPTVCRWCWTGHSGSVVSWLCSLCHCHYLHCPCDLYPFDSASVLNSEDIESENRRSARNSSTEGFGDGRIVRGGRWIATHTTYDKSRRAVLCKLPGVEKRRKREGRPLQLKKLYCICQSFHLLWESPLPCCTYVRYIFAYVLKYFSSFRRIW